MAEEIITLINKRGRIVRVEKKDIKQYLDLGMRVFPNPKQEYFPQYDAAFNESVSKIPLPQETIQEYKLEPIVL